MTRGFLEIEHRGRLKKIEYLRHDIGSPDNPTLVFLHEGLGCTASWKTVPEILGRQARCPVFVYTRLGYGRSSGIQLPRKINYLHTEALTILPAVLKAARIKNYILIGHSDGGSISLIHGGGCRPQGLFGIITMAAHLFCEPVTIEGLQKTREWYETGDLKHKLERIHGRNTENAFWGWNRTWLAPGFRHWNIEKFLKSIFVPVLGIQGIDDPYGTLAQLEALASGTDNCRIQAIAHCGHAPHFQQPETTLSLISGFISGLL